MHVLYEVIDVYFNTVHVLYEVIDVYFNTVLYEVIAIDVYFIFLKGLKDAEEFVVVRALHALISLVELALLQKPIINEFIDDVVPFLCHPVSTMMILDTVKLS